MQPGARNHSAQPLRGSSKPPSGLCPTDTVAANNGGSRPLSFAQERLWFLDRFEPGSALYNVPLGLRLRGLIDVEALRHALTAVLARHDSLRTRFIAVDGIPAQVVDRAAAMELMIEDLSGVPGDRRENELAARVLAESLRPFDLACDLLIRATLFRLQPDDHLLLFNLHHIASDGWSLSVLFRDLCRAYNRCRSGQPPELRQLPIQYPDFAVWQRNWLQGSILEQQLAYWKEQLAGMAEPANVLTDRVRLNRITQKGGRELVYFPAELAERVRSLAQRQRASVFMVLLAAFQVVLRAYTGADDIVVGTVIANRNRVETEDLIGFFVNTLVLRTSLAGNPTFLELLSRVRDTALGAYDHQDLPFEKLVEALQPNRKLNQNPLFQVLFTLENTPDYNIDLDGLSAELVEVETGLSKFDLQLTVDWREELRLSCRYKADLFDASSVRRLLRVYQVALEAAIGTPERRLDALPFLPPEQRKLLLTDWNATSREYPESCVHHLFEQQASRRPDSVAVVYGNGKLTYAELNRAANRLANELLRQGAGRTSRIGICLERSPELIIAMLAALKIGGSYVPLDPAYPRERLAFMIEDLGIGVVVSARASMQKLAQVSASTVYLDGSTQIADEDNPPIDSHIDDIAYVMYTSGSTGLPKGVEVPHRAIVRLLMGTDYARFGPDEIFLQLAPPSFDASTFEIWGALLHGSTLVLHPFGVPSPAELGEVLRRNGVTTLWLTSSLFNTIIDEMPEALSSVRQLLTGGEALSVPHVRRALHALPETQIINGYGPTESTTFACTFRIPRPLPEALPSIPIGQPIANTGVYILNSALQPVPVGAAGELCIAGDGLARGYVNAPELNAQRFLANPFGPGKLYRTGDLARYLHDGNIEFLGRLDDQLKIRGFRIEPGEIESALCRHPAVKSAAVVAHEGKSHDRTLAAYVVAREGEALTTDTLRWFLKQKLPAYMLPARFVFVEALPLTPNGKLDRTRLPQPESCDGVAEQLLAPRDEVETKLVEIWKSVLGDRAVGINDNFFDLGGNSLLASKLLVRIEKAFGKRLAVAALFEAPTVQDFAVLLRDASTASTPAVVRIQGNGSRPPLFCVDGGPLFRPLANRLGEDQPLLGLAVQGSDLAGITKPYRMQDIAARLLSKLRAHHSGGRYVLAGWCLYGLVAFEMAQQLSKAGDEVPLLVLFDTPNPAHGRANSILRGLSIRSQLLGEKIRYHISNLRQTPLGKWRAYAEERWTELGHKTRRLFWRASYLSANNRRLEANLDPDQVIYLASRCYEPKAYAGDVLFIQGKQRPKGELMDLRLGWKNLIPADCLRVQYIPGDHATMFLEPNVAELARVLGAGLRTCVRGLGEFPTAAAGSKSAS